jgi:hypothetical protein
MQNDRYAGRQSSPNVIPRRPASRSQPPPHQQETSVGRPGTAPKQQIAGYDEELHAAPTMIIDIGRMRRR